MMTSPATIIISDNGFCVRGSVGFNNVMALRKSGEDYMSACASSATIVDLSEMKELDAACFTLLLCWMRLARKKNILLSVVNLSSSLMRMTTMFGLTGLFHFKN